MEMLTIPELTDKQKENFFNKVNKDSTGCHLWTGTTLRTTKGYGEYRVGDKMYRAHRVAYFLKHGSIDNTLEIDHLCKTTSCVNPDHLELVTGKENLRRKNS